jgi:hypothetical protein
MMSFHVIDLERVIEIFWVGGLDKILERGGMAGCKESCAAGMPV